MPRTSRSETKGLLRAAWRAAPPSRFLDYKDFLRALLAAVEKEAGRYPYLQFSADLGFQAGNVPYTVIHGYRKLNREQAETIVATLGITGAERRFFFKLLDYTDCTNEMERLELFRALVEIKEQVVTADDDRLMLRFFSEWHHAAIFELVDLKEFRSDPEWIATRFYKRLTAEQVQRSLELLVSLKLIAFDAAQGRHVKVSQSVSTGDEVRGLAAVGYHLQMMALAQAAFSQIPDDEREIGALTISVSEEIEKRLKDDLRLFRRYAVFLSEQCGDPCRIMQLNFQLFPITRS